MPFASRLRWGAPRGAVKVGLPRFIAQSFNKCSISSMSWSLGNMTEYSSSVAWKTLKVAFVARR